MDLFYMKVYISDVKFVVEQFYLPTWLLAKGSLT